MHTWPARGTTRLAKSDPGNAGWQRDLSGLLTKVGNVQVAWGDLAGARNIRTSTRLSDGCVNIP
jgi:hypothetical protein